MRKSYPSDVKREQFEIIKPILEKGSKLTRPMTYDLYDIFCAVLYVLREGCRWRSLPYDYPKWNNVYYHFRKWKTMREDGTTQLDEALKGLVELERVRNGRQPQTSMVIIDSKSIKNSDTAEEKGYDGGKKNMRHQS
jgi:transposase